MKRSGVRLYPSVRLSVPIDRQQQRRTAGLLMSALRPTISVGSCGRRAPALSSKRRGQRHVDSRRGRLNTDYYRRDVDPTTLAHDADKNSRHSTIGAKVRRCNWHSAGSLGWPFPMLAFEFIFRVKYTEAILSNSSRKLLRFETSKIPIEVEKIFLLCHLS